MTVLEAIQRSTEYLARKGVEPPRLEAELLLAHSLGLPRMQLYLNFNRALSIPEQDRYRELVRRRGSRSPLQHIVGSACFCGLDFVVGRSVLVPRPETELLAEEALAFLRTTPVAGGAAGSAKVLDWGTGSGCIAIYLAVQCPSAPVDAVEVSAEALVIARQNAALHNVAGRIRFFAGDGFSAVPRGQVYEVVVANPPYIPSGEIQSLQPEVRDHDPRLALDGGPDGLSFYRRLAVEARPFLTAEGRLMLELGDGQSQGVREIFEREKWVVERVVPDYNRRPRVFVARNG